MSDAARSQVPNVQAYGRPRAGLARALTVARHELRTQIGSPLFWILQVVMLLLVGSLNPLASLPSGPEAIGGLLAYDNSMHALSPALALAAFFGYPFFACLMAGLCLIRDDEAGISELLLSTRLTPTEYLLGKLCGVLGALSLVIVVQLLLTIGYRESVVLTGMTDHHGPFALAHYLVPLVALVVPGVWFAAVTAFVVGASSRRPMAVYAVPTLLMLVTLSVLWTWAPANMSPLLDQLLVVLDPTGLRWLRRSLFLVDHGVAYYNSAPIVLDATFWLGRAITLGVPSLLLLAVVRASRRLSLEPGVGRMSRVASRVMSRLSVARRARSVGTDTAPTASPVGPSFGGLAALTMRTSVPTVLRGARTVLMAEVRELRRQPALWLFTVFLMFVVAEVGVTADDVFGAPTLLTAGTLAVRSIPVVTVLVCLYLLFAVVELMHRDQATGFEAIANSTPVPTACLLLGRAGAMLLVIAGLLAACASSAALLLLLQPGDLVPLWPLGLVFGAVLAPTFVLWVAFMMSVMTVVRHRTAGLGLGLLALLLTAVLFMSGEMTWVNNWPLWGALRWTDLGVFPLNGHALLLNRLAALAWAVAFGALAAVAFRRTEPDAVGSAARRAPRAVLRTSLRVVPFALAPVIVAGFLAIEVEQGWQGDSAVARAAAYRDRNVVPWANATLPAIRAVEVSLDLAPRDRLVRVQGVYDMENDADSSVARLAFTLGDGVRALQWTVDGEPVIGEDRAGLHVLPIQAPVPPGGRLRVGFSYTLRHPAGVTRNGGGAGTVILPAGVLLSTRRGAFLPVPGFVSTGAPSGDEADEATADRGFNAGRPFTSRVRVRAPEGYTVNVVGERIREQVDNGYTTVEWQNTRPVAALNLIAGVWESRGRDGATVFYHATHERNVKPMLDAMLAARTRYGEWFTPYPWESLRLSEFPDLETNATGFPTNISFSEGIGFLTGGSSSDGLAFSVVAHEVAHQWWGHLIAADNGPGSGLLVEGMANFATLRLHEAVHGSASRRTYARQLEQNYLGSRRASSERPLLATRDGSANDEAVLSWRGAWVMWMLRDQLGRAVFDDALKTYATAQVAGALGTVPTRATARDLLARLRTRATDTAAFDAFVTQWMDGSALPEFQMQLLAITPDSAGWSTTVSVRNAGTGSVSVDVVWATDTVDRSASNKDADVARVGARRRVTLSEGETREVSAHTRLPATRVIADPDVRILQRNRVRAIVTVEADSRPPLRVAVSASGPGG